MQIICPVPLTAEQYVEENYQRKIGPPENCPNCQKAHCLEALGYYPRYVTASLAAALLIWVRRFLCGHCRLSVSCLPDFAQPYRLVNSSTVEAGFNEQNHRPDVQRWQHLVESCWQRFEEHLPRLIRTVGNGLGPCPTDVGAEQFWALVKRACGSLATATRQLVHQFRTCLFGTYRCHQRKSYHAG